MPRHPTDNVPRVSLHSSRWCTAKLRISLVIFGHGQCRDLTNKKVTLVEAAFLLLRLNRRLQNDLLLSTKKLRATCSIGSILALARFHKDRIGGELNSDYVNQPKFHRQRGTFVSDITVEPIIVWAAFGTFVLGMLVGAMIVQSEVRRARRRWREATRTLWCGLKRAD